MNSDRITYLKAIGCGLILFLCINYWEKAVSFLSMFINAAMPIFIGFAIAYVLNILMSCYEKKYFPKHSHKKIVQKTRRAVCLVAALLTLTAIAVAIIWLVIPELISCIRFLVAEIPKLVQRILSNELIAKILPKETLAALSKVEWKTYITKAAEYVVTGFTNFAGTLFSAIASVFSGLLTALISFIFAIYLLLAKDKLRNQSGRLIECYINKKIREKVQHIVTVVDKSFHRFIVGQCIEAVILGELCTVGMLIFGFPYATMIGALIGFTALVPIAGAFIGAGIGAVMILTVSPIKAILFIVFIVVLQQLEENLIYPKVVGKSVGLPSLWVLAAVTVGGGVMGIMGMLIGVPLTAAIYKLVCEDVKKREKAAAEEAAAVVGEEQQDGGD